MRTSARCAVLAAAVMTAVAAAAPSAASAAAFCRFEFDVTISPGLTTGATMATFDSGGETGSIDCNGDASGKEITGPGTTGTSGRSTAPSSCSSGEGVGVGTATLPTAGGPASFRYEFTFSYVLGMGPFDSSVFSGSFGFLPTKGNCFSEPVTQAHVMGFGQLNG
jgi:hypothetical protein